MKRKSVQNISGKEWYTYSIAAKITKRVLVFVYAPDEDAAMKAFYNCDWVDEDEKEMIDWAAVSRPKKEE